MKHEHRSEHISYDLKAQRSHGRKLIRQAIVHLANRAFQGSKISKKEFNVLDLGCGFGLLMRDLGGQGFKTTGLDFDPNCVREAKKYGECLLGDIERADELFGMKSFDLVVLCHSLEHMEKPKAIIEQVKKISKHWIIIAVPNPIRPKVLVKYALFRKDYSNKGHFYSWDRSHLTNFLEHQCDLRIASWATDYIQAVPCRPARKLLDMLQVLRPIEDSILPRLFPYFSSSLIVLCRLKEGVTG